MIEYIKGEIVELTPARMILECAGIGYELNISLNTYTFYNGKPTGKIYVYEVIREDAHLLFGFAGKDERELFLMLTSVSGVGPNTARMILSSLSPSELIRVIADKNETALTSVKGIGLKTAQRILVDLKNKVKPIEGMTVTGGSSSVAASGAVTEEAVAALVMLGFQKAASQKAVNSILKGSPALAVEQVIKTALRCFKQWIIDNWQFRRIWNCRLSLSVVNCQLTMRRTLKFILWITILLFGAGLYSMNTDFLAYEMSLPDTEQPVVPDDTVPKVRTRFPVAKTVPEEYQDLTKQSPADLKTPDNVKSVVEYDIRTGTYVVRTKLGDADLTTPISLTPEEYQDYSFQKSVQSYYRQKNEEEFQKAANKQFNLADMQFNIGAAERIFGPGGVRVKTQGSAEVELGLKQNKTKNPSLPERARNRTFFNFDENVQLNVQASVGSKVNFDMNYNTETSFDFDSKKLKLAYTGEEDEIIKSLEAGNVSMTTSNSLINGGAALFGMKADLQFGKLRVNALFAQQESESKTVSSKGGVQTKPFELTIDQYDENRHFFLSHYFRDRYDEAVKNLNTISSPVTISKVEVWVTNKRATYDQARNVVAFADLAEHDNISNTTVVSPSGRCPIPIIIRIHYIIPLTSNLPVLVIQHGKSGVGRNFC